MKKIIFALVFLFAPFLVSAQSSCFDYCADGTFYSASFERASGCTYSRTKCDYGCDGRDKCAAPPVIRDCPEKCDNGTYYYRGVYNTDKKECQYSEKKCDYGCSGDNCANAPTIKIDTCLDHCKDGVAYYGGSYNVQEGACIYKQHSCAGDCDQSGKNCAAIPPCLDKCTGKYYFSGGSYQNNGPLGKGCVYQKETECSLGCDPAKKECQRCATDADCKNSCQSGALNVGKCDASAPGDGCVYSQEACFSATCNPVKSDRCGFRIGPVHFTDPFDNQVKNIPDATVRVWWTFRYTGNGTNEEISKPLPDRATDTNGNIALTDKEMYTDLNESDVKLHIQVELKDFKKRFKFIDKKNPKAEKFGPMERVISMDNPTTYVADFDYDDTATDHLYAKLYYHNWEAVNFSEKGLGVPINFSPPEIIHINDNYCPGTACHSTSLDNKTDFGIYYDTNQTVLKSINSPENLEWHEFCHHIMMDEFDAMPKWVKPCGCKGSCNHCGFTNSTSSDAWLEGWAESCSLMIKDFYKYPNPDVYSSFGSLKIPYSVYKNEEFAVASTIWNLYRTPTFGLSRENIWDVLKKRYTFVSTRGEQHHLENFWEIYQAFNNSPYSTIHQFPKSNGPDYLDNLFITRRCYGDANSNSKWDSGETVGETYNSTTGNFRPNRPRKAGAYVKLSLSDPSGNAIKDGNAKVKVHFDESVQNGQGWDYEYDYPLEDGLIYLEPPEDFPSTIEIYAPYEGKEIAVAKINSEDYWKKYDAGKEFVESYDMKISDASGAGEGGIFLSEALSKAGQENISVSSTELGSSAYKISGIKNAKILWLVPVKMKVEMEIDAKTGNILSTRKPWWSIFVFPR